jgi:3-oxoacyl-(acyl-carrier-protein) synthase
MELALADASLAAHRVDFVMAHATGTPKGDLSEARALGLVFGGSGAQPPVSSLKGHTGHTGGSSGTMSLIAAIDALRTGILEPVLGTNVVDPEMNIDVVSEQSRPVGREVAMVNAFGFGGQNTVALIGAP